MVGTATPTAQERRLEREKQAIVYPAYDSFQLLLWALEHPKEWRRRKEEVKRVRRAYRDLGAIIQEEAKAELIAAWFGDDTGAIVRSMREVREKVRKLIPR